jgi:hypothetical protein
MRFVIGSQNVKLSEDGSVIATYSKTGSTCPSSCMYHPTPNEYAKEKRTAFGRVTTCYTLKGNTRYHQKHLSTVDALKVRVDVVKFLELRNSTKRIKGGTKAKRITAIRWNVSGDVFDNNIPSVEYIDAIVWACGKLSEAGVKSIGYTHGWMLPELQPLKKYFIASCDTVDEVLQAQATGWMTMITKSPKMDLSKLKIADCPNQITDGRIKCSKCMLCSVDNLPKFSLRVIGMEYH